MSSYICFYSHPKAEQEENKLFHNADAEIKAYGMQEHL